MLDVHLAFGKHRLTHFVEKYKVRNIFELNNKAKFETKEEELYCNGLHHKIDAFTTIANMLSTEPVKISEVPLDEGQVLTGYEKFAVAVNAVCRAFDDQADYLMHESEIDPESSVDYWSLWDMQDLSVLRETLAHAIMAGDTKDYQMLYTYLWYQDTVEKTNKAVSSSETIPLV